MQNRRPLYCGGAVSPTGTHAPCCGDGGERAAWDGRWVFPGEGTARQCLTSARWSGRSEQAGMCLILNIGVAGAGGSDGGRLGAAPRWPWQPTGIFRLRVAG